MAKVVGKVVVICLACVCIVGTSACDSSDPSDDAPPTLNGTFGGTVAGTNDSVSVRIVLAEGSASPIGGKAISGAGTITTPSEVASFAVSGSYVHPLFEIDLQFGDRPPGTISGTVSDDRDRITGTITGPGLGGQITLSRDIGS